MQTFKKNERLHANAYNCCEVPVKGTRRENESVLPLENRHVLFEDCTLILRMKRGKPSFAINIDWNKRHVVREEAFSKEEIEDFFKGKQIDPSNNQSGETAVVDIDLYFDD